MPTLADYPELVAQLDRRKNGPLAPESITYASKRRLWWRCPKGPEHLWQAPVNRRTAGHGCPFCRNLRLSSTNSLAVVAPAIARQWHPTKNGKLTPRDVVFGTPRVVWWKCPKGPDHEWQLAIVKRTRGAGSCPFCTGRRPSIAYDLVASAPHLAAEWHPTKNRGLTPHDVTLGSGRRVWWKCPKGPEHVWQCPVGDRQRIGCPFCANMRVSATNSLAAVAPGIAAEWHPTKNGKLTPRDVIAGSQRRVWWKCPKARDHEWPAAIANRVGGKTGCPCCVNRRLVWSNCLAAVHPRIAGEWHPTKNGKLTPRDVVPGTARRVWWRCAFGHLWCASVSSRTQKGSNCPECWRLRRRQPVVTTGRRRSPVRLASYDGAHHGPVRRVK